MARHPQGQPPTQQPARPRGMLSRRSLLFGGAALALGQWLNSCQRSANPQLSMHFLRNSVPPQLFRSFTRSLEQPPQLSIQAVAQLQELYQQLQAWQARPENTSTSKPADLLTLGEAWLGLAVQQKWLQPLELTELSGWSTIPAQWQALVQRDENGFPDPENGKIWAAPYRSGSLMMVYRRSFFEDLDWEPQDWSDLWRPELARQVMLPDSDRTVLGLTLKHLGLSANTENLSEVDNLEETLTALHSQVKLYTSEAYLEPLLTDGAAVSVGWSTDILPILEIRKELAGAIPRSGTLLFADLWVRPASASPDSLQNALDWIDFCWQPTIAQQFALLSSAASPVLLGEERSPLPKTQPTDEFLLPDRDRIQESEFLLPLPEDSLAQYQKIWQAFRTASS